MRRRIGKERPYRKGLKSQLDWSALDKSRWARNSFWPYGTFLDVLGIEDHHLRSHLLWMQDWSATQNKVRLSSMVLWKGSDDYFFYQESCRFFYDKSFFLSLVTIEKKLPRLLPLCVRMLFDSENKWEVLTDWITRYSNTFLCQRALHLGDLGRLSVAIKHCNFLKVKTAYSEKILLSARLK